MQTNNMYDSPYLMWPFMSVYPGKTHEFALHPAFMATQLPAYPTYCRNSVGDNTTTTAFVNDSHDLSPRSFSHHHHHHHRSQHSPLTKPKKSSFTIDSILHRDEERKEEVREQLSPSQLSIPSPIQHLQQTTPETYLSVPRRHQRLLEAAHPYYDSMKPVTPIASASAKSAQKGELLKRIALDTNKNSKI